MECNILRELISGRYSMRKCLQSGERVEFGIKQTQTGIPALVLSGSGILGKLLLSSSLPLFSFLENNDYISSLHNYDRIINNVYVKYLEWCLEFHKWQLLIHFINKEETGNRGNNKFMNQSMYWEIYLVTSQHFTVEYYRDYFYYLNDLASLSLQNMVIHQEGTGEEKSLCFNSVLYSPLGKVRDFHKVSLICGCQKKSL